jgi:FkbM family methyltransferase
VSTGWTVIDIGANIGVFSLYAARAGATIIAYDPLPEITAG